MLNGALSSSKNRTLLFHQQDSAVEITWWVGSGWSGGKSRGETLKTDEDHDEWIAMLPYEPNVAFVMASSAIAAGTGFLSPRASLLQKTR